MRKWGLGKGKKRTQLLIRSNSDKVGVEISNNIVWKSKGDEKRERGGPGGRGRGGGRRGRGRKRRSQQADRGETVAI